MTQNHTPEELDPAAAFEAMGRRLAGLTAAVDGLAVTFQEVHARDYSPELAKIDAQFEAVRVFVDKLKEKPAMALTPEKIAAEIQAAGTNGRHVDHTAWRQAQHELHVAASSISRVVGSALEEQRQLKWLLIGVSIALFWGVVLGSVFLPVIDRRMPESWHWPEQRAAAILQRDGWAAGERLLEVSDPERWAKVKAAMQSLEDKSAEAGKDAKPQAGRGKSGSARGRDRGR